MAATWSQPRPLITGPSSSRLFSLQVPVPPKVFLSMVYKLEGPSNVSVALELTTGDAGSCHIGGIWVLNGEGVGWLLPLLAGLSPFSGHLRTPRRCTGCVGNWCQHARPSCLCCDGATVVWLRAGSFTPLPKPMASSGSTGCCVGLDVSSCRDRERASCQR